MTADSDPNQARVRHVNDIHHFNQKGGFVLYWMQLYRRLEYNHALNHAAELARTLKKPLVVYEGLRLDYPWASARLHSFILEGMQANRQHAASLKLSYWPFVATPDHPGKGLLHRLAGAAAAVVTDDFPAFIVPAQTAALAARTDTPVITVDGNGLFPLGLLGEPPAAAAHLRFRLHRLFAQVWKARAQRLPRLDKHICKDVAPPFPVWPTDNLNSFVAGLPLDQSVTPVRETQGGHRAAQDRLKTFLTQRLPFYATRRSQPAPPDQCPASGLSPYLHFGHISVEELVEQALQSVSWSPAQLHPKSRGKRQGFFCDDENVNSFLDEVITWRDLGFLWHRHRSATISTLATALPAWANDTLEKHSFDPREHLYSLDQLEAADTQDPLWNAAQCELVLTGTIHNYLRMLWGKKVLEWTRTPEEAYQILVHLNNKYALDGRDPNSYSGILWCFGLFDHPWKERPIFGKVRCMTSASTARKFDLEPYLEYTTSLVAQQG